jgi:glycosyltransferase involved in cell wall biosynthesis
MGRFSSSGWTDRDPWFRPPEPYGRTRDVTAHSPTIYLNGRFLGRRTTGVERFSRCLVAAVDKRLPVDADWTLLCPPDVEAPSLERIRVRHVGARGLAPHLWEQTVLPAAAASGLLVGLAGSAPLVARRQLVVVHDAAVFDRPDAYTPAFVAWYSMLFRRLASGAERLVTVSAFSRARLARALGLPPQAIGVVPNGTGHLGAVEPDPSVIDRFALRGTKVLLAVASDAPTKNLGTLVDAFSRLAAADASLRLVIVGGRNPRVFARASGTVDPPGVVRVGPIGDGALRALYRYARALVFPSIYEGFGLPPVEAMAEGCPVVAARAGALPEVCGPAALYVDPCSADAIAAGMRRVLHDASLRSRLVAAGHERVADLGWDAAARRLLDEIVRIAPLPRQAPLTDPARQPA